MLVVLDDAMLETNFDGTVDPALEREVRMAFPRDKGSYFLIGKDGGLKRYGEELDIDATFGLIDSMPMRVQEMRNDRN